MPNPLYALRFVVPARFFQTASDYFEFRSLGVTAFEHDGDGREDAANWQIEAIFEAKPDLAGLNAELNAWQASNAEVAILSDQDWLTAVAEAIEPTRVGPFFIHGAKDRDLKPAGDIGIEIEAGLAFGSGEHATTRACLEALLLLEVAGPPSTVLDMGCGSAVLAIAASKMWTDARILGIEIDPRAAAVAEENTIKNDVGDRIIIEADDGYQAAALTSWPPFDLIFANILADAVSAMAPDARKKISADGRLIVSGLLDRQAEAVGESHRLAGFRLIGRIDHDGWSALTFQPVPKGQAS